MSGTLFGTSVTGDLFLADDQFDSVSGGVTTHHSVLYGGIDAGIDIEGYAGFEVRLGISQYGPLEAYVDVAAPILLDPVSGLTLTNFEADIKFGQDLPEITDASQLPTLVSDGYFPNSSTPSDVTTWKKSTPGGRHLGLLGHQQPQLRRPDPGDDPGGGSRRLFQLRVAEGVQHHRPRSRSTPPGTSPSTARCNWRTASTSQATAYLDLSDVKAGNASLLVYAAVPAGASPLAKAYGTLKIQYATPVPASQQLVVNKTSPSLGTGLDFSNNSTASPEYATASLGLGGQSLSVEFWAKLPASGTAAQDVVGTSTGSSQLDAADGLAVGFNPQQQFFASFAGKTVTGPLADSSWHAWAVTYDATTGAVILYRDGVSVGSGTVATGGLPTTDNTFIIGGGGASPYTGAVRRGPGLERRPGAGTTSRPVTTRPTWAGASDSWPTGLWTKGPEATGRP